MTGAGPPARRLQGRVSEPVDARLLARTFLATVDGPVDDDLAVLVVSELVANTAAGGAGPVEVRLGYDAGRFSVEVDRPPPGPRDRAPAGAGTGGLALVGRVADAWGWQSTADARSRLWCRLPPVGAPGR